VRLTAVGDHELNSIKTKEVLMTREKLASIEARYVWVARAVAVFAIAAVPLAFFL